MRLSKNANAREARGRSSGEARDDAREATKRATKRAAGRVTFDDDTHRTPMITTCANGRS